MTTRQPTAHYHRSQQQELATALVLVGCGWRRQPGRPRHSWIQQIGDGTPFSIRAEWSKLGSSSWPLRVDATDLCCLRDLMMMMSPLQYLSTSTSSSASLPCQMPLHSQQNIIRRFFPRWRLFSHSTLNVAI